VQLGPLSLEMSVSGFIGKFRESKEQTAQYNKKKHKKGSKRHTLKQSLKASLGSGASMRDAVKLPPNQPKNEWLAMNTVELYNSSTLCWKLISEFCTTNSCPEMTAGTKYTYLWQDEDKYLKPTPMAAHQYVELLLSWISKVLDDDSIFSLSGEFGKNLLPTVKKIIKRLARVFYHIYFHHWDTVETLKAEGHINTCFKHLYYFVQEFQIISEKDLEPVQEFTRHLN